MTHPEALTPPIDVERAARQTPDTSGHAEVLERLRYAIADRRDWHEVNVRPDDIAALLSLVAAFAATPDTSGLQEAAQAVVASEYGAATEVWNSPDPQPKDFTWYVNGTTIAALRAALAATATERPLDVETAAAVRAWLAGDTKGLNGAMADLAACLTEDQP